MAITVRPYQRDGIEAVQREWRAGRKRTILHMPTGTGKCVTPDTWVWCDGLRRFGHVMGGSRILGPEGPATINGWYDDGIHEGLKITLESGLDIDCTFNHRLWTRDSEGIEGWKCAKDITKQDKIAVALGRADWGKRIVPNAEGLAKKLCRMSAWERVPDEILRADKATVVRYLRALFFVGRDNPNKLWPPYDVSLKLRSPMAARQIQMLLIGCGVFATISHRDPAAKSESPSIFLPNSQVMMDLDKLCISGHPPKYAWDSVYSITASTAKRIDCEVETQHAFVGNGMVNHNTWVFVFIIYSALQNGLKSLVLVNRDELVQQTVEKLERVGVHPGVVKAAKNEWTKDVVVASIQSLSQESRLSEIPPNYFAVVITDECHYANAPSYQRVLWHFDEAWHLGVTATPFRANNRTLAPAGWDSIAYTYSVKRAIVDGYLCPLRFEQVSTDVSLASVKISRSYVTGSSDWGDPELERVINTPERNDTIVTAAMRTLQDRRVLAFCAGVDHAVDLANSFRRRGIEAFAVYGQMPEAHRRKVLAAHQQGRFPVLTNCNVLTHGYDDPAINAVIIARPTQSKVLYLQEIGRGLRPSPDTGKQDCVILDVLDVAKKHSMTTGKELIDLEEAIDDRNKVGVALNSASE